MIICPKLEGRILKHGDRVLCGDSWAFDVHINQTDIHHSTLAMKMDLGTVFHSPPRGFHIGAGHRSQPSGVPFPSEKLALGERLDGISQVHCAIHYGAVANRWTVVDHSAGRFGTRILCRPGTAYALAPGDQILCGHLLLTLYF